MARLQEAKNNVKFAPDSEKPHGGKPLNTTLKVGMSKDSPFHSNYTSTHPSTKQLLDYGQRKAEPVTVVDISKLPIEKQIQFYGSQ